MRGVVVLVCALGACGYPSLSPMGDGRAGDDVPGDASASGGVGGCDASAANAIACFDFERTVDDAASHLHATATDVHFVDDLTGRGLALDFAADSALDFDDSQVLDTGSITLEAWIKPVAVPTSQRPTQAIVAVGGQYELALGISGTRPPGLASCTFFNTGKSTFSQIAVVAGQWSHVACTFDGATGQSSSFVNGVADPTGCGCSHGPLATSGTTGMSIGGNSPPTGARDRMIGLIDQVRLYKVARTADEICADAGRAGCASLPSCPPCVGP